MTRCVRSGHGVAPDSSSMMRRAILKKPPVLLSTMVRYSLVVGQVLWNFQYRSRACPSASVSNSSIHHKHCLRQGRETCSGGERKRGESRRRTQESCLALWMLQLFELSGCSCVEICRTVDSLCLAEHKIRRWLPATEGRIILNIVNPTPY